MSDDAEFLLVAEYFHPDTASSGKLMTDLAVGLAERGLDVAVYTGQPNYHSSTTGKQPRRSAYRGVRVLRTRAPQVRQSSFARRIFNWAAFTAFTFFGLLFSESEKERELIVVSNPPFSSLPVWIISRVKGWEYTYVVHDLYPDQPAELGYFRKGGAIDTVWSALQARVYRDAKHVVTNGPVMRARIVAKSNGFLDTDDVVVIHNWEDGDFITPKNAEDNWFRRQHGLADQFVVLYSGNIGKYHDFDTVLHAATRFKDEDVTFVFVGGGDDERRIVALAKELGVFGTTVKFLPFQPTEDFPYCAAAADVHLVTVHRGFEGINFSIKIYTAMAAGKPILVIGSPWDDETLLVKEHGIGKQVSQGDVDGLVDAVDAWREDPSEVDHQGARARRTFERYYTKEQAIEKYYRLFEDGASSVEPSFPYIATYA